MPINTNNALKRDNFIYRQKYLKHYFLKLMTIKPEYDLSHVIFTDLFGVLQKKNINLQTAQY
jgi:hypothetical protein